SAMRCKFLTPRRTSARVASIGTPATSRGTASVMPSVMTPSASSSEMIGPISAGLPRDDEALELVEQHREDEADQREHEQTHVHLLDRKGLPRAPDQESEAALGAVHLRDRDQDEADADAQLEPRHDHGERAGQRDGPERVPAVGFVV